MPKALDKFKAVYAELRNSLPFHALVALDDAVAKLEADLEAKVVEKSPAPPAPAKGVPASS